MDLLISNVIGKTQPSPDLVEALVCDLKKKRMGNNPATLELIAIQCVLKNKARFLSECDSFQVNPLSKLPNAIVQGLLGAMTAIKDNRELQDKQTTFSFLLKALNPHILNVHCKPICLMQSDYESELFNHLLHNCPRIQQVVISQEIWEEHVAEPRTFDLFRVMACKWTDLTYLWIANDFGDEGSDYLLQVICSSFKKLVQLEMNMDLSTLTMEGVEHLQKMEKLQILKFKLLCSKYDQFKLNYSTLVHAVGRVPSLQLFSISNNNTHLLDEHFVETYGELYPNKKLALECFSLEVGLRCSWPDCLSLNELFIMGEEGNFNASIYNNMLSANCYLKKLQCWSVPASAVYTLVEKFGPAGLTQLHLSGIIHDVTGQPLDASRVLTACPKIEQVNIFENHKQSTGNYSEDVSQVPLENFKNCTYLNRENCPEADAELYVKYFLGSRKFLKSFKVDSLAKYEGVRRVLQLKNLSCLDQVEELSFSSTYNYETPGLENVVPKVVLPFLERSNVLKKLDMDFNFQSSHERDFLPDWLLCLLKRLDIIVETLEDRTKTLMGLMADRREGSVQDDSGDK